MSAVKNLIIASLLTIGIGAPSGFAVANAVKNKSLTKTVAEITKENKNLKKDKEELLNVISGNENQITELQEGLTIANNLKAEKEAQVQELTLQLESKTTEYNNICAELENSQQNNLELQDKKTELENEISTLNETINLNTNEITQLNLTINSLNATIENLQSENTALKNRLDELGVSRLSPGLYSTGSMNLIRSWDDMVNDNNSDYYISFVKGSTENKQNKILMYYGHNHTQEVDGDLVIGNVPDVDGLYFYGSKLNSIDFTNLDTSKIIRLYGSFQHSKQLTNINFKNFNTTNVTNMGAMFLGCDKLNNLDLSSFNTTNCKDVSLMFYECVGLTSLNISNFDLSNVTSINRMFAGCSSLKSINLGLFDIGNVTEYITTTENFNGLFKLFDGCTSLTDITYLGTIEEWKAKNITNATTGIKEDGTVTVHCSDGDYVITAS